MTKIAGKLRDEFDRVVAPIEEEVPITDISQIKVAEPQKHHHGNGIIIDGAAG